MTTCVGLATTYRRRNLRTGPQIPALLSELVRVNRADYGGQMRLIAARLVRSSTEIVKSNMSGTL